MSPLGDGGGLVALVAHARRVPSEARERFAADAADAARGRGAILLHTCHRAELYVVADRGEGEGCPDANAGDDGGCPDAGEDGASPAAEALALPPLPAGGRRLEGRAAVRHLLAVAAGLDSVVVGEDQILHQLRECLADRHAAAEQADGTDAIRVAVAPLHPVLERAFQVALQLGRESRSWREAPPRSLADVALDAAEARSGPLSGRAVLVVGAGRMARLAALAAARRRADVLVTNRSAERAAALAADAGGRSVPFGLAAPLPPIDAVVLAIGAEWPLGAAAAAALVASPAPVVDLSSPPALPAALRDALGARYTSVDDLARGPEDTVHGRVRRRLERRLDEAEAELERWLATRRSVPAIQSLLRGADARRRDELERLYRRAALDGRERALVEEMSHRLVAAILHAPLGRLRDDASGEAEDAARMLFSL